ncbi:MAG: hypothetical protein RR314_06005 [Oscillospiraceae bacterium]
MKKFIFWFFALLGGLYTIYYYNLDMKLMRNVVLPFLDRHYDKRKVEHKL